MRTKFGSLLVLVLLFSIGLMPFLRVGIISFQKMSFVNQLQGNEKVESAEILFLPKSEFEHLKKGSEIDFRNSRYDVLRVENHGEFWKVLAVNDKLEKEIEGALMDDNNNASKSGKKPLKTAFSGDWISEIAAFHVLQQYHYLRLGNTKKYSESLGFITELLLPPRMG